ncbi:hypothetical protein LY90DRAFT_707046 [Neocallimastix californiae]|uniref:Uncharacterized protein n=1 Tax=Neocallimastix californiae TaxID=1754190 RepID=A0A1Y2AJG3_9FUNG|nr:hypothetical protein LY90DRAFT_707046 [Neocallimastix californiae]|eukprot:ORY22719.1 hypothetical protein LY90DRAFT_707046 [Neocallimastix californiae]
MVCSENCNYIISIRRNESDNNYDDETEEIQSIINALVNDRMNEIYHIIYNNKDSYILKDGTMDKNLKELESFPADEHINGNKRFQFIDKNRSKNNSNIILKSNIEYIPIESKLINHICPILNYYTIRAYLSDSIVDKVKQLPNVIDCQKSQRIERPKIPKRFPTPINKKSLYEL